MADHEHGHDHGGAHDWDAHVTRLEGEAERAAALEAEALAACVGVVARTGMGVAGVVDLGCGPGLATVALARAFADAELVAVDGSAAMLERVVERAQREGVAERVRVRRLDLDGDLASLGPCDVVWSSMAVHHARDPRRLLGAVAALLRPGGVLCLLEHATGGEGLPADLAGVGLLVDVDRVLSGGEPSRRLLVARQVGR